MGIVRLSWNLAKLILADFLPLPSFLSTSPPLGAFTPVAERQGSLFSGAGGLLCVAPGLSFLLHFRKQAKFTDHSIHPFKCAVPRFSAH